jgi:hypothetical protein
MVAIFIYSLLLDVSCIEYELRFFDEKDKYERISRKMINRLEMLCLMVLSTIPLSRSIF